MTLSLCIIARNEEANLGRAIRSFSGLADEVVVLDTGSTDGTVALAESLGARVVEWAWRDDFGAARNEAFSHAQCEWIFLLDADEELLPGHLEDLKSTLKEPDVLGAWFIREDLRESGTQEILQFRLFRRGLLPSQIGRCHPRWTRPLAEIEQESGKHTILSPVRLRHHGYLQDVLPKKLRRGMRLVALELEDRPGQLYYLAELLRLKAELGEPLEGTFQEAWQALERDRALGPLTPNAQHVLEIGLVYGLRPRAEIASIAEKHFPSSLPLPYQLAKKAFEEADFQSAIRHLETFDQLLTGNTYSREIAFQPRITQADYLINLAAAYTQTGQTNQAIQALHRAQTHPEWRELATENLRRITSC